MTRKEKNLVRSLDKLGWRVRRVRRVPFFWHAVDKKTGTNCFVSESLEDLADRLLLENV